MLINWIHIILQSERKPPTELKGTTYITHHFEANMSGTLAASMHVPNSSGAMQQQFVLSSNLVGAPQRPSHYNQLPQIVPSTVIQTPHYGCVSPF